MLNLLPGTVRTCEGVSRRSFLQVGTLGGLGISLPQALAHAAESKAAGKSVSPNNCILIWTRGGTSHHDTFDPKPDAPEDVRGEFKPITTSAPGVQVSDALPLMAKQMHHAAILRGMSTGEAEHGRARIFLHTGYKPGASPAHWSPRAGRNYT